MPLDIATMFSDFIPDTAKQDRDAGVEAANVVGQLGGQAALLGPARARQLSQGVGGMFGLDLRSPAEKLKETLSGVDVSTPEGQDKAFELISKVNGPAGIKFRVAMQEQARANQQAQAQSTQAEAASLNAQTNQANLSIDQQNADRGDLLAKIQRDELTLGEQTQEDLGVWRNEQLINQRRELDIREEANRIDERLAELQQQNLGAGDRNAVREATQEGRELQAKAANATRIANEFKSLQPLAGAASLVVEKWKDITGDQDAVSLLRKDFNAVKNTLVMDSLPPGVASDKDIEIAMSGFPKENWNPEQIYSFMTGMAKVSALASAQALERGKHLVANKGTDQNFADEWQAKLDTPGFVEGILQQQGLTIEPEQKAVDERFNRTANNLASEAERELERRREQRRQEQRSIR